jgi:S1-C subfamily serine protease
MLLPAFFLNCVVAIGDLVTVVAPGATTAHTEWRTFGTGFFYGYLTKDDAESSKREYQIYLVTARHVVKDRQNLKVRLNPSAPGTAGEQFEIPSNPAAGQTTWFFHPNSAVDVAAVSVNFDSVSKNGFAVNYFAQDEHTIHRAQMPQEEIAAGDGIFVLGFPMNLAGQQRNYVIVRQGAIARISEMIDNASPNFMIDAFVFPGNSGGPVVLRPEIVSIQGTKSHSKAALMGLVIQSRLYVDNAVSQQTGHARILFEENAGLADVIPIDYVDEAIAAQRKFEGLPDHPTKRADPVVTDPSQAK